LPFYLPFTFFRFGFFFFAAGLALRAPAARIAPADFIDTPCFLTIDFCAALKPIPLGIVYSPRGRLSPGLSFTGGRLPFNRKSSSVGFFAFGLGVGLLSDGFCLLLGLAGAVFFLGLAVGLSPKKNSSPLATGSFERLALAGGLGVGFIAITSSYPSS
jgi:hypothetical protein